MEPIYTRVILETCIGSVLRLSESILTDKLRLGVIYDGGTGTLRKLEIPDKAIEDREWAFDTK